MLFYFKLYFVLNSIYIVLFYFEFYFILNLDPILFHFDFRLYFKFGPYIYFESYFILNLF